MAKKRGGLAGLYDRNKGWLRYVAPAVVGAIPGLGPLAAAGLGAAIGGDTEGKGYFKGFNTRGAIRGGLEGYSMGNLGKGARTRIGNMLAPKMPNVDIAGINRATDLAMSGSGGGSPALPNIAAPDRIGMTNTMLPKATINPQIAVPDINSLTSRTPGQVAGQSPKLGRVESILSKVEKYPKAFEMMQSALPDPQAQARIDAEMMRARSDEERARLERERFMLEQRMLAEGGQRQANLLRALMPSLADILGLNQAPGSPATRTASSFISGAGPMSLENYVDLAGATMPPAVAPIRSSVSPLTSSVSPLASSVPPLTSSVSPMRTGVNPMRSSVRPLR